MRASLKDIKIVAVRKTMEKGRHFISLFANGVYIASATGHSKITTHNRGHSFMVMVRQDGAGDTTFHCDSITTDIYAGKGKRRVFK